MKRINKYIQLLTLGGVVVLASSCNDFLDREPLDGFTKSSYWTSQANVKTYAWGFYDEFIGYGTGSGTTAEFYFQSSGAATCPNFSDDLLNATFLQYQANASSSNTEWRDLYESVRRANEMLENLPKVPGLSEADAKHWEGVARFFRAYAYYRLVERFGDVPYRASALGTLGNADDVYAPKSSRKDVMAKVLDDINFASTNIRLKDDDNSVNRYVALALKSRICLYEGTYRKYHALGDEAQFLQEAKAAASAIMITGNYELSATFKSTYNSESLAGNKEMILYRSYIAGVMQNSIQAYNNTSSIINGMSKAAVQSYACTDGLPVGQSAVYQGDATLAKTLANRDQRLAAVVDPDGLAYVGGLTTLSRSRKSTTGYVISLYNNGAADMTTINNNTVDAPIFTYSEVLLNYAEACAELKSITSADLDKSVNLLRARVGLPKLVYVDDNTVEVGGVAIDDPKRTTALEALSGIVPSIIWEIRRERRAELMTWTHMRYFDLMRWKKGDYLDFTKNPDGALGAYIGTPAPAGEDVHVNAEGYIQVYTNSRTFDPAKHYLSSIPTNEIQLYENKGYTLDQNPFWK